MNAVKVLLFKGLSSMITPLLARMNRGQPLLITGAGSSLRLCEDIARFGAKSTLIVTDKTLNQLGLITPLKAKLEILGINVTIYDGVDPDPSYDHVRDGVRLALQNSCDSVLAVGGGSSIDAAKAIAACMTNNQDISKLTGINKVKAWPAPLYVIPTTAGTGSEVSPGAVLTDPEKNHKGGLGGHKLFPIVAALDPELMAGMPAHITAATGMDALTHAIEAYLSRRASMTSDRYALAAIKLIFVSLPRAYHNGGDLDARLSMGIASTYAGLAFASPLVGYVHAIAHRLGERYHVPHGLANGVVLPRVLEVSVGGAKQRMAQMARAAGLAEKGESDEVLAQKFIDAVKGLAEQVGIPQKLEVIRSEDIPAMAKAAMRECSGQLIPDTELSFFSAMAGGSPPLN